MHMELSVNLVLSSVLEIHLSYFETVIVYVVTVISAQFEQNTTDIVSLCLIISSCHTPDYLSRHVLFFCYKLFDLLVTIHKATRVKLVYI